VAFKKVLSHHTDLFYKLRYLFGTFKWFSQWCQTWGFASKSGLSMPFWVFLLKIWGF